MSTLNKKLLDVIQSNYPHRTSVAAASILAQFLSPINWVKMKTIIILSYVISVETHVNAPYVSVFIIENLIYPADVRGLFTGVCHLSRCSSLSSTFRAPLFID